MLRLGKRTEYALIALAYLAERAEGVSSAREIAEAYRLPLPLLMKILKCLHCNGLIRSARGVHGGYQLMTDLRQVSLFDLTQVLRPGLSDGVEPVPGRMAPTEPPLVALRYKMQRFLKDVKLSDLIVPGRRIDVPLERVGIERIKSGTLAGSLA